MKKKVNDFSIIFIFIVCALCIVFVTKSDYEKKRRETIKTVCHDMSRHFPIDSGKYEECVVRNVTFGWVD